MKDRELLVGNYYSVPYNPKTSTLGSIMRIDGRSGGRIKGVAVLFDSEGKPSEFYPKGSGDWGSHDRYPATEKEIRYLEDCLAAGKLLPWDPGTTKDNYLTFN